MSRFIRAAAFGAAIALSGVAHSGQAPLGGGEVVPGVWQHHKITISYFGLTSAYACDALETRVRSILLLLGARKDAKVEADCPRGPDAPSHNAWITADFFNLAPADSASVPGVVKAHWAARKVTPHQPLYMGDGDCELIEQMRDLISKNFSLRDVQYRTDCVPYEITVNGFAIEAQALIAVDQPDAPNDAAAPGVAAPGAAAAG